MGPRQSERDMAVKGAMGGGCDRGSACDMGCCSKVAVLSDEVLRLRSLLARYLYLVQDEEGYDYLDSDWSGRFTDAEAAELRAMMAARPQR